MTQTHSHWCEAPVRRDSRRVKPITLCEIICEVRSCETEVIRHPIPGNSVPTQVREVRDLSSHIFNYLE